MGRNMTDNCKNLWERYPHIWKSESAFLSWIRGNVRRNLWSRHPVKIEFIKNNRIRIPNPNPKGRAKEVWGAVCALTGETHVLKDIECDHIKGNHSLTSIDDIQSFIEGIVLITEDDLQLVSKDAHKIKSYAERKGISFEEAKIEKEIIRLCKDDKLVVAELTELGIEPKDIPKTKAKKKELLSKLMKGEYNGK